MVVLFVLAAGRGFVHMHGEAVQGGLREGIA